MGDVRTFTPRSDAPQAAAIPAAAPVRYPALTREQARADFLFGLRASRDHLDALVSRTEAVCSLVEVMARARVLNEGLEASGRALTALHQLGDPPGAA